jgi:uncharacterized protein YkwD
MKTKVKFFIVLVTVMLLFHCAPFEVPSNEYVDINYEYSYGELELVDEINSYRNSLGRDELVLINYISSVAGAAATDMASLRVLTHNGATSRFDVVIAEMNVEAVGEILAYGYTDEVLVVKGWDASPIHKKVMVANYDYIGVGIRVDDTDRKYYVAIFARDSRKNIGVWCNGNTTVFGAVVQGSSPCTPTNIW